MDYVTLGRTGLRVSVAGLGGGGGSRLGLHHSGGERHAAALVREAYDLGVNFFDSAVYYGTETAIARGLSGIDRDSYVLCTKSHAYSGSADRMLRHLADSLRNFRTDHIDIYLLHGLNADEYGHATQVLAPVLQREKEKGTIGWIGFSEYAEGDARHDAIRRGLGDGIWDVFMLAFSMMNQNARQLVFPKTQLQNNGTLIMYAVRNLFSRPNRAANTIRDLVRQGALPPELAELDEPLRFLIHEGGAQNIVDAAYRYARDEPGVHVVMFGTADAGHLRANIECLSCPPLPAADRARLTELFGSLEGVGLEPPLR